MDIWVFDITENGVKTAGISENAVSFMWTERFEKADTFSIELPPTNNSIELFKVGRAVAYDSFSGIITNVKATQKKLTVGGTSFDGMLAKRVIADYKWDDTVMTIIDKNCATLAEIDRRFPSSLVDYTADAPGNMSSALSNGRLSDYTEIIGLSENFGVFGRINHTTKQIEFYGRYAQNRSVEQNTNKQVVFSDNYENITDVNYTFSRVPEINRVKIFSEGQYDELNHIDLDSFEKFFDNGTAAGFDLAEEYIEIDPVTTVEYRASGEASAVAWTILSYERTLDKATQTAQAAFSEAVNNIGCQLLVPQNWRNKFAVGDVVTINVEKYNMTISKRLAEITTFISRDKNTVEAVIGEPAKTLTDMLRKR